MPQSKGKTRKLTEDERAAQLIGAAQRVLITTLKNPKGDALVSALALSGALKILDKDAHVVIPNSLPEKWQFLPGFGSIKQTLAATRPLIIKINTSKRPVAEVRYEEEGDDLLFFVMPKQAAIPASAVSVVSAPNTFDLAITLGVPEQEMLEDIHAEDPRLLYDTPIVALDTSVEHSRYGELNLIHITSSSIAEIVLGLLPQLGNADDLLTKDTATLLLAGIVSATNNFQDVRTTPDSLHRAAMLITKGANQQAIIRNLYRSKPLNALKLWGKAMVSLIFDQTDGVALSTLGPTDFEETVTTAKDVAFVLEEMRGNLARASIVALLWQAEADEAINGCIEWAIPENLEALRAKLGGSLKNHRLVFKLTDTSLETAQDLVQEAIRQQQKN